MEELEVNRFVESGFWSNLHMFIRVFHPVNVQRREVSVLSRKAKSLQARKETRRLYWYQVLGRNLIGWDEGIRKQVDTGV